jgi:hypothetical protein
MLDPALRAWRSRPGASCRRTRAARCAAAIAAAGDVPGAPFVEVGSYCRRSTIWLGDAARQASTTLFAVDHHRGSENQAGWDHHDDELVDGASG